MKRRVYMAITKNKITITFESNSDRDETEKSIEAFIVPKLYDYVWNVSNVEVNVEEEQPKDFNNKNDWDNWDRHDRHMESINKARKGFEK